MIDLPNPADAQRLAAARRGDRAAFESLVTEAKAGLYRLIRRYVGDADDAYDVLQETFVSVWLALAGFDPSRPFGPWVRTIAMNKCRDFSRRRSVRQRFQRLFLLESGESGESSDPWHHPDGSSVEDRDSARLRALDRAISELPRQYKEPLILTALHGLSHKEAAAQLGISAKAVELRMRRARLRLQPLLRRAD